MKRFLVTGGAGFIGSHLVDGLRARGDQVAVLDDLSTGRRANLPPAVELIEGDVADPATVRRAMPGVDGVFHLAAIASVERSNRDWLGTHRTNQTGTIVVLDAARKAGGLPVVYASSAAVYGDRGATALSETMLPAPLTAYGADKLGSELHAAVASRVHGVPTVGLRFFNVYGPRQDPLSPYSGVIGIFAGRLAKGEGLTIHGDGEQVRDFVYVSDVVAHLLAAFDLVARTERHVARVLNVATGQPTSINALAHVLGEVLGRPVAISHGPRRTGDIRTSVADVSEARRVLGCSATIPLRDGLVTTLGSLG